MNKLLLVTHNFPPTLSSETLMVYRTVKALSKFGWKIDVVTTKPGNTNLKTDNALCEELPSDLCAFRGTSWDHHIRRIPFLGSRLLAAAALAGLPEPAFLWYPSALYQARKAIRKSNYNVLYSRAQRNISNVVALSIKRQTGLPWIAHFSDPWIDVPFFRGSKYRRSICEGLEQTIIREADAVVFTNEYAADIVMKKYPEDWRGKVHCIPHGYDEEALVKNITLKKIDSSETRRPFKAIYTGTFYPNWRTPESLFKALSLMNADQRLHETLEIDLIGPATSDYRSMAKRYGIAKVVQFTDEVPFEECQRRMNEADILLVIDAVTQSDIFLPTKVIDYLPYEKPVIGITPKEGATADVLRSSGHFIASPLSPEAIAETLGMAIKILMGGEVRGQGQAGFSIQDYSITNVTRPLNDILCRLTG